jgi:hypothetical protein
LADRARLALTPYGAVPGCNRCSTASTGFASGLHSAGSPSQDTRAAGSQSVAHKANSLSSSDEVFSALGAAGWRSTYRAPEYRYCRGHERGTDKDAQRRSPLSNCCNVQAAVGFDVTFQWRRRREACSMITKMYRTRKLPVTATQKLVTGPFCGREHRCPKQVLE